MTDMKTEPVACMIRSRSLIAQASIAVDGKDHFSAWSEWAPNSIEYGRAVTDPIRNNPVCYEMELLFKEQPAPLKIGSGVTVENIGFGSEQERKPYLVFDGGGFLTEVNLIDVSLVSKRQAHTIADLEAIGVRVEQPAPVAVVMPFAEKVISKLRRFIECAEDGQGADIGRHWLDLLTQLGLLNRVQRSPALWEITDQGEEVLEVARLNGVKP